MKVKPMTPLFRPPVPQPPDTPLGFWDRLRVVRTNALQLWSREAYEKDTLFAPMLGKAMILLNRPQDVHHVLVEHPDRYQRSAASVRILRPIAGQGLLLSEGENWRWQRRTVAPALAPRSLPLLLRHVVTATDDAVATLGNAPTNVDMLGTMQNLALEIAGRSMFSLETARFGGEMRRHLAQYAERLARPHMLDMLLPHAIPAPLDLPRWLFQRRWMRFMETIIAERLAAPAPDTPRDLFDLLRAARDPETGRAFAAEELRDQVTTLILAGHETTAVALFWSFFLLANAPDIQGRVAAEAETVAIGPDTATAALEALPYPRAVLNEALRLYPPAFTLVRQARVEDRIGDMDVRPGSVVMIAPWVLHRHRNLWRDPELFDPSRFLPGAPAIPRFAYLPFGAGPRICVGAQFALAEATLVLASMVRAFNIALAPGEKVMPVAVITTQPDHPALFTLTPRGPATLARAA
jgi:cytochrome P450